MSGALSNTDGSLEIGRDAVEGWYDRAGDVGLLIVCVEGAGPSSLLPSLLKRTLVTFAFVLLFGIELSTSCIKLLMSLSGGG